MNAPTPQMRFLVLSHTDYYCFPVSMPGFSRPSTPHTQPLRSHTRSRRNGSLVRRGWWSPTSLLMASERNWADARVADMASAIGVDAADWAGADVSILHLLGVSALAITCISGRSGEHVEFCSEGSLGFNERAAIVTHGLVSSLGVFADDRED